MMKLTKEEIQFIDNYLIKNEVKFWDVRLELLDHIVSAVEDKMTNDGISFNEALLEVHRGFGNQFIEFGVPKDKIFEKGLYQSNIGFKKFTRKKQRELGKGYNRMFLKLIKQSFLDIKFYLELITLSVVVFMVYSFSPKYAAFTSLGIMCIPFIYVSLLGIKNSFSLKSLSLNMSINFMSLWILIPTNVLNILNLSKDVNQETNYEYLLFFFAIMYIPIRVAAKLFQNVYSKVLLNYRNLNLS
ncbi:hypothetical protein DFQ10_101197 [Winogradskyella eximia]|uniref:Uncharacterized protein n=1 Tax=Winogradskyella eximia TaxID=262006 RepID=A0A3D9HAB6_9FLAO|nr:hypothetical protein [Winogradskyella eximia]RED46427.1 hypothetical protein DFQ10_101197 [Winogradskyella eximia]|tara:strand:- start:6787 stop:7515 length:729 start_codon:yes stop_codon:yes gene_type:complete